MAEVWISRAAAVTALGLFGATAHLAAQERSASYLDKLIGRDFVLCKVENADPCLESQQIPIGIREVEPGKILLKMYGSENTGTPVNDIIFNRDGAGAVMAKAAWAGGREVIETADSVDFTLPGYRVSLFERNGHPVMRFADKTGEKVWYEAVFMPPDHAKASLASKYAAMHAKYGKPSQATGAFTSVARGSAAPSADPVPPIVAAGRGTYREPATQAAVTRPTVSQRFGVWQQMSGQTWEFIDYDNDVPIRCFVPIVLDSQAMHAEIPFACDSGEQGKWIFASKGPTSFAIANVDYVLRPDGSATFASRVSGTVQTRSVIRMLTPDKVEVFKEEAKAGAKKPKWVRSSNPSRFYTAVEPKTVRQALAAGPKRIAAAREALIPQQWGFLADLPGKVEIGITSNAGQRATMALNVRREPGNLLLRAAEWVERGKTMRLNYTAGSGLQWSEEIARTGTGTFNVLHKGPNGSRTFKAQFVRDQYSSIPHLKMQLGAMPCGQATRVVSRSDYNGHSTYSDNFTAVCRGGEYGGYSTYSPTGDRGASTIFASYSPNSRKSFETQLASLDKEYDQSDRDYIAYEKREAVEKRRFEAQERANKARMNAVIMNGIVGIAGAVAQGRQQGQQQRYETERNVAAYTALGIAKRAEAAGQPLDARTFNQALERALAGTGIRQSVINEMRVGTGSSSQSGGSYAGDAGSRASERDSRELSRSTANAAEAGSGSRDRGSSTRDASGFNAALERIASGRGDNSSGPTGGTAGISGSDASPSPTSLSKSSPASSGNGGLVVKDDSAEWRKQQAAQKASRDAQEARERESQARALADQKRRQEEAAAAQAAARAKTPTGKCGGKGERPCEVSPQ